MTTCLTPFGPIVKALCCNECGREVWIIPPEKVPEKCPHCLKAFKHGWDALINKKKQS